MIEYATSSDEMNRRKIAFKKLVTSFFVTAGVFSYPALSAYPAQSAAVMLLAAGILYFTVLKVDKVLESQKNLCICLTDSALVWKFDRVDRSLPFCEIRRIRIKRTSKGTIREITIAAGKEQTYINGLRDFEAFADDLTGRTANIEVTHFKEPIDFDHPLFYVFLGITLGTLATSFVSSVLRIGGVGLRYFQLFIAAYLVLTGAFFLLKKPIGGRYGEKKVSPDLVFGVLFLFAGMMAFCSLLI